MPENQPHGSAVDGRLDELFAEYLEADESGKLMDSRDLVERYSELADAVAAHKGFGRLVGPLRGLATTTGFPSDETETLPPETVIGDYEVLEEIGRHGQGVVYKARHRKFNHLVALKMLLSGPRATEKEVHRFIETAENLAALDHPHIVPIYGGGEFEGRLYFTMRLMVGGDLAQTTAGQPMSPQAAARLLVNIAWAVHHAHQRGILHRDLKPSNILLDAKGQPCVADFGLSKRLDQEAPEHQGSMVGAPAFVAPEQIDGQTTVLSDVYGLGTILYWLLTGQPPFNGQTREATFRKVREGKLEPPHTVNSMLGHWWNRYLEQICQKCLARDSRQRYQSAEALADDLDLWLDHKPPHGVHVARPHRLCIGCRRNPVIATLTGAIAVLLVLVTLTAVRVAHARRLQLEEGLKYASRIAAENVRWHFDDLSHPVLLAANEKTLADSLKNGDLTELQRFVEKTLDEYNERYGTKGVKVFRSLFVMDTTGNVLAIDWALPPQRDGAGDDLGEREYFRHHKVRRTSEPYVSQIFQSVSDGHWKIAISAAVRDGEGSFLGVVAATVVLASRLGAHEISQEVTAVLVGRHDRERPIPIPLEELKNSGITMQSPDADYLIFIHPKYVDHEKEFPREVEPIANQKLLDIENLEQGMDANYEDPLLGGRWIAVSTRVNENFLVIVQQRRN